MRSRALLAAVAMLLLCPISGLAQVRDYFTDWDNRVQATMDHQPDWVVPLVTAPSGVYQLLRFDTLREISSSRVTSWNYGDQKGLILIPWYRTELDIWPASYLQHSPTGHDGFGDSTFQFKYRPFAQNNEHGDYSVNFALEGTIPTGSHTNGAANATITPSVSVGKGYGAFDVQSSLGGTLPAEAGDQEGRTINWNSVLQWHPGSVFWPELEDNATFYVGGPNDGKLANFLTPGLMLDSFKLIHHNPKNRLALLFGGGVEMATSHYHSYNHGLIFTGRLNF